MAKYLDPKADLTFKKVFGEHPDLMMSFLNAILPLQEGKNIVSLEYLTPEMVPDTPTKKYSIVDVRCRDNANREFIVEMQMYWTHDFLQRALFNTSKAYVRPLEKGDTYDELREVYSINIINDIAFPDLKDVFYHRYMPANIEHPEYAIKGYEMIFIELPKFRPSSASDRKMMALWLRFLTEINEQTKCTPEDMNENEDIRKAMAIVEESAFNDSQRMAYDKFWDEISSARTLMHGYFRQGLAEGREAGLAEGREAGLAEGREAGRTEEKYTNARNLKANGVPNEIIAKSLDIPLSEIEQL